MYLIRVILFSAIVLGSGWFFYDLYIKNEEKASGPALTQLSYKKPLPYFTVEQTSEHKPEYFRVAKIEKPTLFIEGNTQAAEKVNAYIQRMINDEIEHFFQPEHSPNQASSSSPFLETLSIQFEELYTHPQLMSIALHISRSTKDTPTPVRETSYAIFDGLYGSQLSLKKLFAIFDESAFAETVCAEASEKLSAPTKDDCVRAAQDPKAIGIDEEFLHIFLHTGSSTTQVHIPIETFQDKLHPNIQLALTEHEESMRMSLPE